MKLKTTGEVPSCVLTRALSVNDLAAIPYRTSKKKNHHITLLNMQLILSKDMHPMYVSNDCNQRFTPVHTFRQSNIETRLV